MEIPDFNIEELPIHFSGVDVTLIPSTSGTQASSNSDSDSDFNYSDNDGEDDEDETTASGIEDVSVRFQPGDSSSNKPSNKKKPVIRKNISKLPKALKGLMGEANLRYARGEVDVAEKMCYELIRQAPDAYEPYLTLTQIYESRDPKKCEVFLTLATRLNQQDVTSWCRLAEYHLKVGKLKEAMSCYTCAVRADPKNIDLHLKRIHLAEKIGNNKVLLKFKAKMASHLPKKREDEIISIIKEVVMSYHEMKSYDNAIEALEIPFKRIPRKVTQDLINMMLELLLLSNKHVQCIDIFSQFCGFEFELCVNEDNTISIDRFVMPEYTQVDIRTKFIICAIRMKSVRLISSLIDSLLINYEADKIGDLYLDIAETLMQEECYEDALKLLVPLVKSKDYSLAAVWLKYAECLSNCRMFEQAVEAYFTVIALAPKHIEVIYPLAMLLLKLGNEKEAFEVLSSQDMSCGKLDVAALLERMRLLKKMGNVDEYFKCAEMLLSRHCVIFRNLEEIRFALTSHIKSEKYNKIKKMREFFGDDAEVISEVESIHEPSVEEEYKIYKEILNYALQKKEFMYMQKVAFTALTSSRFIRKYAEMVFIALYSCIRNNDTYHGYTIVRDLVLHNMDNHLAWNLLNMVIQISDEVRHIKFINRFQIKRPMKCLEMIEANNELTVGNVTSALKYYMKEFKRNPSPFLSFMLGVVILQICSQRHHNIDKKALAQSVTYLFLNYNKNRSRHAQHEVYYNLGRMYQQLGVIYLAEYCYKLVLKNDSDLCKEDSNLLSLKYEAAYNLHLIYRNNGNLIKARNVLLQHLVI